MPLSMTEATHHPGGRIRTRIISRISRIKVKPSVQPFSIQASRRGPATRDLCPQSNCLLRYNTASPIIVLIIRTMSTSSHSKRKQINRDGELAWENDSTSLHCKRRCTNIPDFETMPQLYGQGSAISYVYASNQVEGGGDYWPSASQRLDSSESAITDISYDSDSTLSSTNSYNDCNYLVSQIAQSVYDECSRLDACIVPWEYSVEDIEEIVADIIMSGAIPDMPKAWSPPETTNLRHMSRSVSICKSPRNFYSLQQLTHTASLGPSGAHAYITPTTPVSAPYCLDKTNGPTVKKDGVGAVPLASAALDDDDLCLELLDSLLWP